MFEVFSVEQITKDQINMYMERRFKFSEIIKRRKKTIGLFQLFVTRY